MLTNEENELLSRIGPGTPMGKLMRQYWLPANYSYETEPDGQPIRVRLLGEDLLAWRDTNGVPAFTQDRCPHRGVSFYFGRNEECGLRCAYHGWQFDVEGQCIDVPTVSEKIAEGLKPKAQLQSLSVKESLGVIWVHFGQPAVDVPTFDFASLPEEHYFVSKKFQQCNWAQAVEGGIDTAHFSYLHANIENGEQGENNE
mgnify:CR=1 FL=1